MTKKIIENLGQILRQLNSNGARAKVISGLVSKGVEVPKSYLNDAIDYYEKTGRFVDAAKIAKEARFTERAIDDYERAEWFVDAAEIAKEAGLIGIAIDDYERAEMFDSAAEVAEKAGLTERAGKLYVKATDAYEKAGMFNAATHAAEKAGLTEKAKLYKTLEKLLK